MGTKILNDSYYMNIIKVLGIIMVVGGHTGFNLFDLIGIPYGEFKEIFPAYSYHMPLFIFISGYFINLNKNSDINIFVNKKVKSLIVPYYITNIFYAFLTMVLVNEGLFYKSKEATIHNIFVEPWISGYQFNLNGPGWFVLFLFLVQVTYLLFRTKIKSNKEKEVDFILLGVFILLGFVSTYLSINFNEENNSLLWIILRTSFGFQFYHLGYIYKKYLKDKIPLNVKSFLILIVAKILFIAFLGNYTFSMRALVFRDKVFLPLIVSIMGIYYILHVSKFIAYLTESIKNNKIKNTINYIGNNTWAIMMHHMTVNFFYDKFIGLGKYEILDYFVLPLVCTILPLIWSKVYTIFKTLRLERKMTENA